MSKFNVEVTKTYSSDSVFSYPGNVLTAKGGGGQHTPGGSGGGRS